MDEWANLLRAVSSFAWPAVALTAILLFRAQIGARINSVRRFKAGPLEAEWDKQVAVTEAQLDAPPKPAVRSISADDRSETAYLRDIVDNPVDAILSAHADVVRQLRALLQAASLSSPDDERLGVLRLANRALEHNLITPETRRAIEGITVLRNLAAHDQQRISSDEAVKFVSLVEGVQYAIDYPPSSGRAET